MAAINKISITEVAAAAAAVVVVEDITEAAAAAADILVVVVEEEVEEDEAATVVADGTDIKYVVRELHFVSLCEFILSSSFRCLFDSFQRCFVFSHIQKI